MSSRIKGITIEIGGETKGLDKALSGLTKQATNTGKELKDVERLLKLNPGNTELIAQKQALLAKQVENTSDKLKTLKDSQEQVQQQFEKGEIGEEQYRAFSRELEATEGALKGYKGQLNNIQGEQDRLGQNTQRLDTIFEATGSSVDDFRDVLGSRLTNAIKNGTASADDMEVALNKIGKSAIDGEVDIKVLKDTLDKVNDGSSIDEIEKELESLKPATDQASDGIENINQKLSSGIMMQAAEQVAAVGESIIGLGKSSLDAFDAVDEGLDTIVTKTGAGADAMAGFEGVYKNIGSSMPVELAKVGEAIGEVNTQLGLQGDELDAASRQAIAFSEINGQDVTSTVIQAKQALEAYSLENKDFAMVLDSVTKVAQDTGQATGDLLKKAIDGAPQIKALGLEFSDGVALMGQFEKSGVDSGAALSSLGKASVAYAKDGKTLENGLKGTMDAILGATNETEALTIASEVFGTKGAVRMVDAIKRGSFSLEELGNTAEQSSGKVATTFEDTLDPIDEMTVAQNNLTFGLSELGGAIAETLAPVLQGLSELIQGLTAWFSQLSPTIKEIIILVGGMVAIFSILLPVVVAIVAMVTTFGTLLLPIVGIVAAVIAGITALILVFRNWGTIVDWLKELFARFGVDISGIWSTIQITVSSIVQSVVDFVMSIWGTLVTWWNDNNQLILATVTTIWGWIQSVITNILNIIVPIIQMAWNNILAVTSAAWSVIQTVISTAINVVLGVIKTVMQIIQGDWSGAWNSIKGILSSVWSGIQNIVNTGVNYINRIVSNTFNGLVGTVKGIWSTISNTISSAINTAKNAVKVGIDAIKNLFNFKFSWPHIPLPHFSVSGSANPFDWLKNGPPKLNVSWFAKGGILTKPTVFGMNGNTLMAGGEAGKEAVIPLNEKTLGMIGQGIADAMNGQSVGDTEFFRLLEMIAKRPIIVNVEVEGGGKTTQQISEELAWLTSREERGFLGR